MLVILSLRLLQQIAVDCLPYVVNAHLSSLFDRYLLSFLKLSTTQYAHTGQCIEILPQISWIHHRSVNCSVCATGGTNHREDVSRRD